MTNISLKHKKCITCKTVKSINKYSWRNKACEKRKNKCKECVNRYSREHYNNNKDIYKEKAKNHNKKYTLRGRIFLRELKMSNPCVYCGESNPNVLEFDHINPSEKKNEIAYMATHAYSIETIKKEACKCVILCANCHRERTARQLGWYNYNK